MSALAVSTRSLFDEPVLVSMRTETPHRPSRVMRIWREVPTPREETERAPVVEFIDEECERWDGLS